MINEDKKIKFIQCECGGEGVLVTHWEGDTTYKEVYFTMFSSGTYNDSTLSFRERIRHAWNIIKTGHPFTDSLILTESAVKELGQYLINIKFEDNGDSGR